MCVCGGGYFQESILLIWVQIELLSVPKAIPLLPVTVPILSYTQMSQEEQAISCGQAHPWSTFSVEKHWRVSEDLAFSHTTVTTKWVTLGKPHHLLKSQLFYSGSNATERLNFLTRNQTIWFQILDSELTKYMALVLNFITCKMGLLIVSTL